MIVTDRQASMPELLALIERTWGYRALRPLQQQAMQAALDGTDSVVVMPTGGGKSLCYQAPAVLLNRCGRGPTVVVSPLIALMKDQVDGLRSYGIAAAQFDSSLSALARRNVLDDLRSGRLDMLFVSPERLVSGAQMDAEAPPPGGPGGGDPNTLIGLLRQAGVRMFAIDEAHCISSWGHDFRPEYRQLAKLKQWFPDSAVHAFTATATPHVRSDIAEQLQLIRPVTLVGNFDRPNLTYRVLPRQKPMEQIREVLARHEGEAGIIYCMRRRDVEETTDELRRLGIKALGYHAGMNSETRTRIQEAFAREECDVIVATVAFGMGINRSNIRFVLHAGMPKSVEAYQQETGRAGRDGLEAECVLLYSGQDVIMWKSLMEQSVTQAQASGTAIDPHFLPNSMAHLEDMNNFARGAVCRHQWLVEYFGQCYNPPLDAADSADATAPTDERSAAGAVSCRACDHCLGDTESVPEAAVLAQKILSAVARTGQRFGAGHVVQVLRGETSPRIRELHHDQLSVFGLLKQFTGAELRDFIGQLAGQSVLQQDQLVLQNGHVASICKLNNASMEVLRGNRQVRLIRPAKKQAAEARRTRGGEISWQGVDTELFESLRGWRKTVAAARSLPPFMIFSDATLRELARRRPSSVETLEHIHGIGRTKLDTFGPELLALIGRHCADRGLAVDVAVAESPQVASIPTPRASGGSVKRRAFEFFAHGMSVAEVAGRIDRAPSTTTEYLADYIAELKPACISAWVSDETADRIKTAAAKVGIERLKPIFTVLDGSVPYDDIRIVVGWMRNKMSP